MYFLSVFGYVCPVQCLICHALVQASCVMQCYVCLGMRVGKQVERTATEFGTKEQEEGGVAQERGGGVQELRI